MPDIWRKWRIKIRSICAALTPSCILRSRNSAIVALLSLDNLMSLIGSLSRRWVRPISWFASFPCGVISCSQRTSKFCRVNSLGAVKLTSPVSILVSTLLIQTLAFFYDWKVLLIGFTPSRRTCAWYLPFCFLMLPICHLPCDRIVNARVFYLDKYLLLCNFLGVTKRTSNPCAPARSRYSPPNWFSLKTYNRLFPNWI